MTRDERAVMINELVDYEIEVNCDRYGLEQMLRSGIKGYDDYTDEELQREYDSVFYDEADEE